MPSSIYEESTTSDISAGIASWLTGHPESTTDYEGLVPTQDALHQHQKPAISQQPAQDVTQRSRKRLLQEVSGNAMSNASHTVHKTDQSGDGGNGAGVPGQTSVSDRRTPSPRKRPRKQSSFDEDSTPQRLQINTAVGDNDKTPQPPFKKILRNAPGLLRSQTELEEEIEPFDSQSNISPAKSGTTVDSRASSPTKGMADFQFSNIRVDMPDIDMEAQNIPADLRTLFEDLDAIAGGYQLIPYEVKEEASKCRVKPHHILSSDADASNQEAVAYGGLAIQECFKQIQHIHQLALDCRTRNLEEAAWNSEVHSRLLNLSMWGPRYKTSVYYCQITHARITDRRLLPTNAGLPVQSKMVDFAIVIEADQDFKDRVVRKLQSLGNMTSVNQSEIACLKFDPIAISIETKKEGGSEVKGNIQLSTWVAAQYAKLRRLAPHAKSLPGLPVILTSGHDWFLMFAEMKPTFDRVTIYRDLQLGSTKTIIGTYQIIASLQRLIKWVQEVYRPWFQSVVLDVVSSA